MSGQEIFTIQGLQRSPLEVGQVAFSAGNRWDSDNVYGFITANTVRRTPKWRTKQLSRYVRAKRKIEKLLMENSEENLSDAWRFKVRFSGGTKLFYMAPSATLLDLRARIVQLLYLPPDFVDSLRLKCDGDRILIPNPEEDDVTIFQADIKPNTVFIVHDMETVLDSKHISVLTCLDQILTQFELGDGDVEKKLGFVYYIAKDILENPKEARYRSLNSKKMEKILSRQERKLLVYAGFQRKEDRFFMKNTEENLSVLELVFDTLQNYFVPRAGKIFEEQKKKFIMRKKKWQQEEERKQKMQENLRKREEEEQETTEMFFSLNSSNVSGPSRTENEAADPESEREAEGQALFLNFFGVVLVAILAYYAWSRTIPWQG